MFTQRICRLCLGKYVTGTDEKGEKAIPRNSLELSRCIGFFPAQRGGFDICHECYDDLFRRLTCVNSYIGENLSDFDKGIVTGYHSERGVIKAKDILNKNDQIKELPKNEK